MIPVANEFKIKQKLCDIGRRIWQKGFCAGNEGNHSYRLGPNKFLCTPTGVSKGTLAPDDICTVDGDGKQLAGRLKRSSEFLMHAAIYKARPDVVAVIHSHPPHATAFAIAGVDLPTCIHPEAEVFLGPVKTAKYVTPGDQRLADSIVPFTQGANTVLMGNHGVVCFDTDLEQCYYKLEIVDAYARILLLTAQLGSVNTLTSNEMGELIALKNKFGLPDPRSEAAKKGEVFCNTSDYISRVGGTRDFGSRGKVMQAGSATPLAQAQGIEAAIGSLIPNNASPADFEKLVQTITDQIMAVQA
ncbi:MAG: class II aldolase/adducin family protein [Tepidisphaeraceae bacterium]